MSKNADGDSSITDLCTDITDREVVQNALTEMGDEGRLMISDGRVYLC